MQRTAPLALIMYSLVIVWFHKAGHPSVRFPFIPWYSNKQKPSCADMLTTLQWASHRDQTERPPSKRFSLKTVIGQIIEFLSRAD